MVYRVVFVETKIDGWLSEQILFKTTSMDDAVLVKTFYTNQKRKLYDMHEQIIGGYYVQDRAGCFVE